ncbi:E3 ubiquitin-protein ligase E3D isoform X1 [Amia ocellicauda]|uniref:E3 ubiquitin-protein ligase E3D isoform X1 n=1 Tax=Amia ocellicauda TaxID=2972642 RepID=UPI003463A170
MKYIHKMDETEKQVGVFLELRKRLQSGHLVLSPDLAKSASEVDVSCGPSCLQIKTPGSLVDVQLPVGVSVVADSCREVPGAARDGLHMRLQLNSDHVTEVVPSLIESLKAQKSYWFACQSCGESVLMERVFLRVLPLPGGNWNTLVDDWCCHPDPFANRKLLPRKEDCLLGDTFILLNWDCESSETMTKEPKTTDTLISQDKDLKQKSKQNDKVICKSCGALLGEAISPDTLKLYITEVTVRLCEENENPSVHNRSLYVENVIAARLVELSTTQSTFRFSVQDPSGKAYILLWLLNTDTLLVSSMETSICSSALISSQDSSCTEHKSQEASSVIKVLYLPCLKSQHQDVIDAWEKNIGVHQIPLPRKTCHDVLEILSRSTATLPPSMRTMNAFQVAFMKL